ncbi:hypothetical protein E3C22_03850 [Jiella endophytica]|uniref:Uncharacterized protein n=1 Tax=Jiella endophytica TaxID=2558362 RepID=A0A4Y8RTH7_9HYPH|nr:hypothetical protein [Jiella endophytica]TFF27600.1 hypothetical protein E3C22_03850 [Jiella endophytica]
MKTIQSLSFALFCGAALLVPAAASAGPAECLVEAEGQAIFDGRCDFKSTDKDGSFEFSGAGLTGSVLVDPGATTGIAFYENKTGRGENGSWRLGDVDRDGACWKNQYGRICAWALGTRPGQGGRRAAAPVRPTPVRQASEQVGGRYRFPYATLGEWEIARYTFDPAGRELDYCSAVKLTGSEQGLRAVSNIESTGYGFSGYASVASSGPVPVAWWFDNDPRPVHYETTMTVDRDPEGFDWRMLFETNDDPGSADGFMNSNAVHYAYVVDGQDHVETFSLSGSNAALKAMFDCRQ